MPPPPLSLVDTRRLSRAAALGWLADASQSAPPGAETAYLPPHGPPLPADWMPRVAAMHDVAPSVAGSETGAVLFWSQERTHVLLPPFLVPSSSFLPRWGTHTAAAILNREWRWGAVLVRLGRYAIGVYEGERLLASKTDSRLVHGRHAAGGWSQQRFARRREKQARELFDEVCEELTTRLKPYLSSLDYLLLGGERQTLLAFHKRCPLVESLAPRTLHRRLSSIREPNQQALEEEVPRIAWQSTLLTLAAPSS